MKKLRKTIALLLSAAAACSAVFPAYAENTLPDSAFAGTAKSDGKKPGKNTEKAGSESKDAIQYEIIYEKDRTCLRLTPSKAGNVIRYTIDGSEPTKKSPEYVGKLAAVEPVTVRAAEFTKKGKKLSEITVSLVRRCRPVKISAEEKDGKFLVTLSAATKNCTIYYTTDGSKPDKKSSVYKKPFKVKKNTVVSAYAVRKDWKSSEYSRETIAAGEAKTKKAGLTDEEKVLSCINKYRKENGLEPLKFDEELMKAAAVRVSEIAGSYGHTRPDGRPYYTALEDIGFYYHKSAENIAWTEGVYSTPESVSKLWIESPAHRANILTAEFDLTGIGVLFYNNKTYWVQLFAKKF